MAEITVKEKELIGKIKEIINAIDSEDASQFISGAAAIMREILKADRDEEPLSDMTFGLAMYFAIDLLTSVSIGKEPDKSMRETLSYFG